MNKNSLVAKADLLAELHASHTPLVLPTVWDAWSARTAVAAGAEALTIGSHPLADSRGEGDGEQQSFADVVAASARIIGAVDVPVSVDLESGYGQSPADLIAGLLEAGGVGLNVEDTVHLDGGRPRTVDEHADYVRGLRAAADDAGVAVWINGRTDLFKPANDHDERAALVDEAIERLQALVEAGANSVYPVKIQDDDEVITRIVQALPVPVNITAHPVKHDLARFVRLGVGRVTFGPLLQSALTDTTTELVAPWVKN